MVIRVPPRQRVFRWCDSTRSVRAQARSLQFPASLTQSSFAAALVGAKRRLQLATGMRAALELAAWHDGRWFRMRFCLTRKNKDVIRSKVKRQGLRIAIEKPRVGWSRQCSVAGESGSIDKGAGRLRFCGKPKEYKILCLMGLQPQNAEAQSMLAQDPPAVVDDHLRRVTLEAVRLTAFIRCLRRFFIHPMTGFINSVICLSDIEEKRCVDVVAGCPHGKVRPYIQNCWITTGNAMLTTTVGKRPTAVKRSRGCPWTGRAVAGGMPVAAVHSANFAGWR